MLGPIQPELHHWIRQCKYVTLTHPIIRHLMRHPHKIIDDLQLENSNLMRRVKELEWNPHLSEEEEQSATEGNTADTRSNWIRCFSRTYAYTVNMSIATKECAPSKDAKTTILCRDLEHTEERGIFVNFRMTWRIRINLVFPQKLLSSLVGVMKQWS